MSIFKIILYISFICFEIYLNNGKSGGNSGKSNGSVTDKLKCDKALLTSLGVTSDESLLGEKSEICPGISQNCCGGKQNEKLLRKYWDKVSRKMSDYYKFYYYNFKYALGISKVFEEIAHKI